MKTGLVMEGGAMRGMFTAGVTDVLMENGVVFDGAVGVSAGAVFGCNYKSHQPGRVIRYNTTYCADPRYASIRNLLRTGDLYDEQFCYHQLPDQLDPFDTATFASSPMEFYVVCTDVKTGKPVYHRCTDGGAADLQWMRASASMPLASRVVKIGSHRLLDGGIGDSIPVDFMRRQGYARNVLILTQPAGFVKQKNKALPAMRLALHRYPAFLKAAEDRHLRYNQTLARIAALENVGEVYVIRPPIPLEIGAMERSAAELRRVYETGRLVAENKLEEVRAFLAKAKAEPTGQSAGFAEVVHS